MAAIFSTEGVSLKDDVIDDVIRDVCPVQDLQFHMIL